MYRTDQENERLWYAAGFTEMAELYDDRALAEGDKEALTDRVESAENLADELREALLTIARIDAKLAPAIREYLKSPEQINLLTLLNK